MTSGWHQRRHERTSVKKKKFTAGHGKSIGSKFSKLRHFDEDKIVNWGFDLTSFKSADSFKKLLKRNGLYTYQRVIQQYIVGVDIASFTWSGGGLTLITKNNPITGEHGDLYNRELEGGYAGYIGINGRLSRVLKLVKDIKRTAEWIKDESPYERSFI